MQQRGTTDEQPSQQQESRRVDIDQQPPKQRRVKQRSQRYSRPEQEQPAQKKKRTNDQAAQSTQIPRVNPDDTSRVQKGQASTATVQEALGFSDILTATHELAVILQFGTSYELVEWLAKRLQEVSERMAQEHRDQIMIQKSLCGAIKPNEQAEVDRIGRQRHAKNRGEAIQIPPLHEALVEVHREYEKASRAARDMAELYKQATTAADVLNAQYKWMQAENQQLKNKLQEEQVALEKAREQIFQPESQRQPLETDSELQKRLDQAEKARREAEIRAEKTEDRSREMEARLQSAKTTTDRCLGEKDNVIQDLRQQLAQQQETTRQQVEELEEYVKSQETCFTTQLAGKDKLIDEINEKIIQQQNDWNEENAKLENQLTVSEKRRLDLLVAQAKLMQAEGHTNAVIIDLRKTLATTQFEARMTQDRVQAIIRRHRINTLKLVNESLEKGWQTWSAQAAELQLLRADRENRKVQGKGFLKMSEEAMTMV